MHAHIAEKTKFGSGSRVFALVEEGGALHLACIGDFETIRYHFNQLVCLAGGVAMEQLLLASGSVRGTGPLPLGTWRDRTTMKPIGTPAHVWSLAACGPNPEADLVGAMGRFGDWPEGMAELSGYKHLITSIREVGDLFYDSTTHPVVRVGRAQEKSTIKRVQEAILHVKHKGYSIANEDGLLKFMGKYAKARQLLITHTVDAD